jgi:hypothetical protein
MDQLVHLKTRFFRFDKKRPGVNRPPPERRPCIVTTRHPERRRPPERRAPPLLVPPERRSSSSSLAPPLLVPPGGLSNYDFIGGRSCRWPGVPPPFSNLEDSTWSWNPPVAAACGLLLWSYKRSLLTTPTTTSGKWLIFLQSSSLFLLLRQQF